MDFGFTSYDYDNNPIEFKNYTSLIRIQSDEGTSVDEIVKNFSLNGIEKNLKTYISAYNSPLNIKDVPIDAFVENTNDLFFELIPNSKIIVTIFRKDRINLKRFL